MKCYNEGDSNIWTDRCGGALQGGMDCEGSHPASHAEIQKTPGAGTFKKFISSDDSFVVMLS